MSLCFMLPGAKDLQFPAAPVNLTASVYYRYAQCEHPALNISWEIRFDCKLPFITSTI